MRKLPLDESIKEIEIHVIISRISKEFYVWKTKSPNSYQVYKLHVKQKFKQTRNLFQRSEDCGIFPQMYLLDTLVCNEETAFKHCIAWTKYFQEHGFEPLANDTILDYTAELNNETKQIYDAIRNRVPEDVLISKRLLVEDYQKRNRKQMRDPKTQITFYVNHKEYQEILKKSECAGIPMARFCKNMVLSGNVVYLEPPPVWENNEAVREANNILKQILYAIYQNGKYYPADMENIRKMVDRIEGIEDRLMDTIDRYTDSVFQIMPK